MGRVEGILVFRFDVSFVCVAYTQTCVCPLRVCEHAIVDASLDETREENIVWCVWANVGVFLYTVDCIVQDSL